LYALLISQKLLIELITGNYLTSYWMTMLICKIVRVLAAWYSTQTCSVKWGGVTSLRFRSGNGAKQGGVISPYLFARYKRELLGSVRNTGIGCFVRDVCMNILAYADDIVVLAPSWHALQSLLNVT